MIKTSDKLKNADCRDGKQSERNEQHTREVRDKFKRNSVRITGAPEEQGNS